MIKRHIPNAITCGNLLCGCLAIIKCFEGDLVWASYLVGIAAVLDFFDGFAARMLRITSAIGKDLDSLADMVTFGVVPGMIMFKMISSVNYNDALCCDISTLSKSCVHFHMNFVDKYLSIIAFLIPVFSAIRLAKFNNDTRQTESFIGLPTPANAMLICSIPLIVLVQYPHDVLNDATNIPWQWLFFTNQYILSSLCLIFSILLLAPIPMFSLKFKRFGWNGNKRRYTFLLFSIVLLVSLQFLAIPLIIVSYILFSFISNLFLQNRPRSN